MSRGAHSLTNAAAVWRRPLGWASCVVSSTLLVLLLAIGAVPVLTGGLAVTVTTGSMVPAIRPGTLVISRGINPDTACQSISAGQIITYDRAGQGLVTHRVTGVTAAQYPDGSACRFTVRGDANPEPDAPVAPTQLRAAYLYQLPWVGAPWLALGPMWFTILSVAASASCAIAGRWLIATPKPRRLPRTRNIMPEELFASESRSPTGPGARIPAGSPHATDPAQTTSAEAGTLAQREEIMAARERLVARRELAIRLRQTEIEQQAESIDARLEAASAWERQIAEQMADFDSREAELRRESGRLQQQSVDDARRTAALESELTAQHESLAAGQRQLGEANAQLLLDRLQLADQVRALQDQEEALAARESAVRAWISNPSSDIDAREARLAERERELGEQRAAFDRAVEAAEEDFGDRQRVLSARESASAARESFPGTFDDIVGIAQRTVGDDWAPQPAPAAASQSRGDLAALGSLVPADAATYTPKRMHHA